MATIDVTRFKNAVQRDIRNFGLLDTAKDYTFRTVNEVTVFRVFRAMMIERIDPQYLEPDRRYECRFLNPDEIFAFSRHPEFELSDQFVRTALKKGDQCYAILDGHFLASYAWYSSKPTLVTDEIRLRFNPKYVYMYNTFTHSNYRGQRLNAAGIMLGLNKYLRLGAKGIVFCVEENNYRSLRSVYRLGCLDFGRIIVLKVFGRYLIHHSPGCKDRGFAMHAV